MNTTEHLRERRVLVGLLLVTGALTIWLSWAYIAWAFLGLLLAWIVHPLHGHLASWSGHPRISAGLVVALLALGLALPLVGLVYALIDDITSIAMTIRDGGSAALFEDLLARFLPEETAQEFSLTLAERAEAFALSLIPHLLDLIVQVGVGVLVLGSFLYAGLVRGREIVAWVKQILPVHPDREDRLLVQVGSAVDAVFYGLVVVAAVQAAQGTRVWWVVGLPNPIFWGTVMLVLSMVPALGPFFVMAPAAIWSFLVGDLIAGIVLVIAGVVLVGAVDNVMRPWLVGRKGGLPPSLVLLSVVGGLVAVGPVGVFFGPLAFAVFLKVAQLAQETREPDAPDPTSGEPAPESASP